MAKAVALRLAEQARVERLNEQQREERTRENMNVRNRSNNPTSNHHIRPPNGSTGAMNRSGNNMNKQEPQGAVKLPKVNQISSSNVSSTSMKAVSTGSKEESRK
jgi:hypothetical protein